MTATTSKRAVSVSIHESRNQEQAMKSQTQTSLKAVFNENLQVNIDPKMATVIRVTIFDKDLKNNRKALLQCGDMLKDILYAVRGTVGYHFANEFFIMIPPNHIRPEINNTGKLLSQVTTVFSFFYSQHFDLNKFEVCPFSINTTFVQTKTKQEVVDLLNMAQITCNNIALRQLYNKHCLDFEVTQNVTEPPNSKMMYEALLAKNIIIDDVMPVEVSKGLFHILKENDNGEKSFHTFVASNRLSRNQIAAEKTLFDRRYTLVMFTNNGELQIINGKVYKKEEDGFYEITLTSSVITEDFTDFINKHPALYFQPLGNKYVIHFHESDLQVSIWKADELLSEEVSEEVCEEV